MGLAIVIESVSAEVAELADASALGAGGRKAVEVRPLSSAPKLLTFVDKTHAFQVPRFPKVP
jgi:hypothetical protein